MSNQLCISPRCRAHGQHADDCTDDQCRGCVPRRAADGSNLCHVCGRKLGEDIAEAGRLWAELGLVLTAGERPGERVSGASVDKSLNLNERAMKCRTHIWATLSTWARLVSDERNVRPPIDQPAAIASWLHRHTEWLAAHGAAGEVADQMAEIAHGQARRIAYPNGSRVFEVAPCPVLDDDGVQCQGTIKAVLRRTDSLLPSQLVCDADDEHVWDSTRWVRLGIKLNAMKEGASA